MRSEGSAIPSTKVSGTELQECPVLKPEYASQIVCPLIPVLEELPAGIIISDHEGRFTVFNREAERILGVGPRQVGPSRWSEVYGCYLPDKVTPFPAENLPLTRALRGEEVRGEKIFIRNAENPAGAWIRASSKPFSASAETVGSAVVVFNDITKSQMALETIELLSRAVEQTADSILITNRDGIIRYVNQGFEVTSGYTREEVLGHTPRVLKSGRYSQYFYREIWDRILAGNVYRGTIVNRKKSGELYWAEQTITAIKNDDGRITHFVSVLKDITQARKQQEHEIQLQLARQAQQRFYAPKVSCPKLDIGSAVYPAIEVGGDYIDLIKASESCVSVAVGDISGHGFDSALLMALTRAYVRSFLAQGLPVVEVLKGVNKMLLADLEESRYVTLVLVQADGTRGTLSYASAGHVPGFVLNSSGEMKALLESISPPLGLFEEWNGESKTLRISPGDLVVLLTDGASEASDPSGEELGQQRIIEYIRAHRSECVQELADGVCQHALSFGGTERQQDDIAAVILKNT